LWLAFYRASGEAKNGCDGGACPFRYDDNSNGDECGMWMGPSQIKKANENGFGLGIFTGRSIPKGTLIEPLYNGGNGVGEPLIPLYGHETLYTKHPPLREYVWDEDNMPEVAVEYPIGLSALFIPGLASVAPCTDAHYNLELYGPGQEDGHRYSVKSNYTHNHGAHAIRHNVTFAAIRDIAAGEELTVQCSDDDFDGGTYFLQQYETNDSSGAFICLDQLVQVAPSPRIQGHGLVAKRTIAKDSKIISSPLLPIHRKDLTIVGDVDYLQSNARQLLLNYCYGSSDSDLLWLPYGPMINYLNHAQQPNAGVQWQPTVHLNITDSHVRQQHHHPELFHLPAKVVANIHGKSLTLEVVALRTIEAGEEVTIDYGIDWQSAYEKHIRSTHARKMVISSQNDVSAEEWNDRNEPFYKTIVEQLSDPYPDNLEVFCFYEVHLHDDEHRAHQHSHNWDEDQVHACFRPCEILERNGDESGNYSYTVKLSANDDRQIIDECILDGHDEILHQVPQAAVRVVDRPFTTPALDARAFRHEIGFPKDMIPESWKRKRLRPRFSESMLNDLVAEGEAFKRKKAVEIKAKGGIKG